MAETVNPVLILAHNNLELTKRCVASVLAQDIPTFVLVLDNGSTDGTWDWLLEQPIGKSRMCDDDGEPANTGVSHGWNEGIRILFSWVSAGHVLVIGNDTEIPPWFYRSLLDYKVGFVTGVAVDDRDVLLLPHPPEGTSLVPHPDFSAFLIRQSIWDEVGEFDEAMKFYAQDCDYHVRAHQKEIALWKANVPFYHERSSTIRNAPPEERMAIERQADTDREMFKAKWGCKPGDKEYGDLFSCKIS